MPELPELEIVCEVLNRRIAGKVISGISVAPKGGPIILRNLLEQAPGTALLEESISSIRRRGKFLDFELSPSGIHMVINPKLTGRLRLSTPKQKAGGSSHLTLQFQDPPTELRYLDQKRMGQIYLTRDLSKIPAFEDMGPDALEIEVDEFIQGVRSFRGEIKGILTRGKLVAGIGNAYADEILWEAKIHPFQRRASLSQEELERLYQSMRSVLKRGVEQVRSRMGDDIHLKPRDFFTVHLRGDEDCPRCGTRISSITANQRITNFCRTCQPGGLFKGM